MRADVLLSCICQALSHEYCDVCERNLCSEINKKNKKEKEKQQNTKENLKESK